MKRIFTLLAVAITVCGEAQVSICLGESVTLFAPNPSALSNASYSINPGGITSSTSVFVISPTASAVYTIYTTGTDMSSNLVTTATQTNAAVNGLPSFSLVSSPPGFTLGCSTKSTITVSFVNAQSAPPSGGAVSYTLLGPGNTVTINGILSTTFSYNLNLAGSYTAITRDNTNGCDARLPFSVLNNKLLPSIDSVSAPVITCANTVVVLQAFSPSPNINFMWTLPQNIYVASNTISVQANLNFPPSATVIGVYTVNVQDNNNLCSTSQAITVKQNRLPPTAKIIAASNSITCAQPTVVLTNGSNSNIPPNLFPNNLPVSVQVWQGPSPSPPSQFSSTYMAAYPGVYTMTVMDENNGCMSTAVYTIQDMREYTLIENTGTVDLCEQATTTIMPVYSGTGGLTYQWSAPSGANTGPTNGPNLVTDALGSYTLSVTNTNGCESIQVFEVAHCVAITENTETASFNIFPNPGNGIFKITTQSGQIISLQVYDAKMALIRKVEIENHGMLDITTLPSGIYFIKGAEKNAVRKVIKD
jgi:hypothetical protein